MEIEDGVMRRGRRPRRITPSELFIRRRRQKKRGRKFSIVFTVDRIHDFFTFLKRFLLNSPILRNIKPDK